MASRVGEDLLRLERGAASFCGKMYNSLNEETRKLTIYEEPLR
jgi:hypothetical protein